MSFVFVSSLCLCVCVCVSMCARATPVSKDVDGFSTHKSTGQPTFLDRAA